jgi:predicted RNA-binding Zn-ribbon protein involved in translation (DUF1610 family)
MKTLIIAIASMAFIAINHVQAYDYSKSSKEWNRKAFHSVETPKAVDELPEDAQIAMACSKCKSVTMITKKELATKPGHGTKEEVTSVHQCPGCGGKITTKSTGKETAYIHTCSECGEKSAFCCATKAGEKTSGMEKHN